MAAIAQFDNRLDKEQTVALPNDMLRAALLLWVHSAAPDLRRDWAA